MMNLNEFQSQHSSFHILYRDDHYIAIEKPAAIHVHPTSLSPRETSCMQILRNQIDQWVYTVHRLDRATSGVLIFALSSEAAKRLHALFVERKIKKRYLAVVRGWLAEPGGVIDYPLRESDTHELQEAQTAYQVLDTIEFQIPISKFPTARFSLVEALPHTGRNNQIRKHFAHLRHPIIGDTNYGDGKQNRFFREHLNLHRLMLMATHLQFQHPFTGEEIRLTSNMPEELRLGFEEIGWSTDFYR
ncbi:MAG: pseudouridine synthase [Calditrichia bacterium]